MNINSNTQPPYQSIQQKPTQNNQTTKRKDQRSRSRQKGKSKKLKSNSQQEQHQQVSSNDKHQQPNSNDNYLHDQQLKQILGFNGFGSSKGKNHTNSAREGVLKNGQVKRVYRQYMNRRGGFNRNLDKTQ